MTVRRAPRFLVLMFIAFLALPLSIVNAQSNDLDTWEAEFFPVSVSYDGDLWKNRSTSSFDAKERFQITARATVFTLQAFDNDTLDGESCLSAYIDSIADIDGVSTMEENDTLDMPTGLRGASDTLVTYEFLWPGRETSVPMVQYLSCQRLDEGSLLLIGIETRAGIYDEEIEIINAILDGVVIAD